MIITIYSNEEPIFEEYNKKWEKRVKEYSRILSIRSYNNLSIRTREGSINDVDGSLPLNICPPAINEIVYKVR